MENQIWHPQLTNCALESTEWLLPSEGAFAPQLTTVPTTPCCPLILRLRSVVINRLIRSSSLRYVACMGPELSGFETSGVETGGPVDSHSGLTISPLCSSWASSEQWE